MNVLVSMKVKGPYALHFCTPSLIARLEHTLGKMAAREGLQDPSELTNELHVYPDHHGNRSPLADPSMRGGGVRPELGRWHRGPGGEVPGYCTGNSG